MKRLLILLAICAVFLFPLARPGFFVSDDGEWMIIRLSAFYQSLAEGQFPVRFLGRLNNSYGYPVANFLYPGFLYIGSLLHLAGVSFVNSVKIILAGSVIGASIALYALLRRYKYAAHAALAGVAAFLFSPYLGYDVYRRGSVGEVLGFFAGEVVIYALVSRMHKLLPLAVAFLVLSHNSLALLVLAVCGVYILLRRAWDAVLPVLLGLGMSAFFWLPALLEQRYVPFGAMLIADPKAYLPVSAQLLALSAAWIVAALVLLFQKKLKDERFWLGVLLMTMILASPLALVLWGLPLPARLIQFPYRLLGVSLLAAPVVVAGAVRSAGKRAPALIAVLFIMWGVVAFRTFSSIDQVVRPDGFYSTNEGTTTVADEYLPVWVRERFSTRANTKIEVVGGDAQVTIESANTQTIRATIEAQTDSVIQINTIYYPGWGIVVDDEPVAIDYSNPQGVMRVDVPEGTHTLHAEFRETVPRFAADAMSFLSAGVFGLTLILKRKKR